MAYKIIKDDGSTDKITNQLYENYDDAYEILEEVYTDICCSEADYEDRPYYEIIEVKEKIT